MRLTNTFVKTQKQISAEEKSINAQLLIRGGFVDQLMAGVYTYMPMGLKVLKKVEQVVREEMNSIDSEEVLMPSLQPKENWEKTGRWESLDVLFRFNSYYTHKDYVFAGTHEEVVSPLLQKFALSYKDLPRKVFQIQTKFRDELRAKSGILRGREFIMKDLYSFHTDEQDLNDYYEQVILAYQRVYQRLGLGDITYLTYASGGTFSKYSHEFQTVCEAGEDIIYTCDECKVAINKEIYHEQNTCPKCGNANLIEKKAAEVGNIFKLMTKYSVPFKFTYTDKDGNQQPVIMGCYGIGVSRLMGVIVETHYDDKGIIWDETLAPYKYIIIPIGDASREKGEEIYSSMKSQGMTVAIDDRDASAGYKLKDADLIGYPYQIIISDKTLENGENMVELVNRKTGEKTLVDYKTLTK